MVDGPAPVRTGVRLSFAPRLVLSQLSSECHSEASFPERITRNLERSVGARPVIWDFQPPQILHSVENDTPKFKVTEYSYPIQTLKV